MYKTYLMQSIKHTLRKALNNVQCFAYGMFYTWTVNIYTMLNALLSVCFTHGLSIYTMFNALHTACFTHGLSIYTMFNALHTACFTHGLSIYILFNALHTVCFTHGLSIYEIKKICQHAKCFIIFYGSFQHLINNQEISQSHTTDQSMAPLCLRWVFHISVSEFLAISSSFF